ncbi:hypothetical protein DFH09DRAFT_1325553 [Mycena vulgaris]|nr:hypothetical protein DFH09DRAFT_1325553 [Mycena vulgaris]
MAPRRVVSDSDSDETPVPHKENLTATEEKVLAMTKTLNNLKKKMGKLRAPLEVSRPADDDDGPESEDLLSDGGQVSFPSAITPLGRLPVAPPRPTTILRKAKKSVATETPKISSRVFKRLPELTAEQLLSHQSSPPPSPDKDGDDRSQMDVDSDNEDNRPRAPIVPSKKRTRPVESDAEEDNPAQLTPATAPPRKRAVPPAPESQPPAKRPKAKANESKFRQGFVVIAGVKPKAGDYEPIERYILTDRMAKLITKRGSHIRGKIVDGFRPLFAVHYGFLRSTSKTAITANRNKSELPTTKAAFHYKDIATRTGYGSNSIIATARHHSVFKDKNSLGAIWRSYFDPISVPYLAMDFSVLEFLANEWSTGIHVVSNFTEKEMIKPYRTHVDDINEWCDYDPLVTENIRRKWFKRASQTFGLAAKSEGRSHIDTNQQDALRAELAGRTGETDSEPELEDEVVGDAQAAVAAQGAGGPQTE